MSTELLDQLQSAQQELDPQFKALRSVTGALRQAAKLASDEKADALAMQKALGKLEKAASLVTSDRAQVAVTAFSAATHKALDALAFEFAQDLRAAFEGRGQTVGGRPPTLVVDPLVLNIDIAARKAQWLYGKEPLTRPIALSINTILTAYDQQRKAIVERELDAPAFLAELYKAWQELMALRTRRPAEGRINIVEVYSKVVMNRQSGRFWNAPSRSTFRDYDRQLFVRDLVLVQTSPLVNVEGKTYRLRLAVATKNQADNPSRSIWLPSGPQDGQYYADLAFEAE